MQELDDAYGDLLTPYARRLVRDSAGIPKEALIEGLQLEGRIYAPLGELLEGFDALLCPTFAVPALPAEWDSDQPIEVNGRAMEDWVAAMMTIPFNIASRCPVMSVPSGTSRIGVPTGLSIVGRTYDDVTVFRIAAAYEQQRPWFDGPLGRPEIGKAT
jgi:Asp-tRNA(Asn)/Glu-tRNA(Gln) amidotransferase A subunit family amidase